MGLAGFNRARLRKQELEGASAPSPIPKPKYEKRPEERKPHCSLCDKTFQNLSAYSNHMRLRHKVKINGT